MGASKKDLVILGTGGHARVIVSLLKDAKRWNVVGLLDREPGPSEERIGGYPVIGSWPDAETIRRRGVSQAAVAVGDNGEREKLYHWLLDLGFKIPTLIHSTAYVDHSAQIGDGCVVCMGALVGANVTVGPNSILNSGSIVDHECDLATGVHIAPGCKLAGRVKVGARTFIGIGASVIDGVRIGENVTVGAGAVVIADLPDRVVAGGVPARIIRQKDL